LVRQGVISGLQQITASVFDEAIASNDGASLSYNNTSNEPVEISVDKLNVGIYVAYAIDEVGNISAASNETILVRELTSPLITLDIEDAEFCSYDDEVKIVASVAGGQFDSEVTGVTDLGNGEATFDPAVAAEAGLSKVKITYARGGVLKSIDVSVRLKPEPDFEYVINNNQVQFIDYSTNVDSEVDYLWAFGDGNSSPLKNPIYFYNEGMEGATVSLTLTDKICPDNVGFAEYSVPVSVEGIEIENDVNVYPNPTNGLFTIDLSSNQLMEDVSIRIINVTGQVLRTDKFGVNNYSFLQQFNISEYDVGVYFIEIVTNSEVIIKRIEVYRK
jgi:hypothetical protein